MQNLVGLDSEATKLVVGRQAIARPAPHGLGQILRDIVTVIVRDLGLGQAQKFVAAAKR
jgi:hypothetical protein